MLITKTEKFTLERTPSGEFLLTNIATGETITLETQDLYELSEFLLESLEELEFDSHSSA